MREFATRQPAAAIGVCCLVAFTGYIIVFIASLPALVRGLAVVVFLIGIGLALAMTQLVPASAFEKEAARSSRSGSGKHFRRVAAILAGAGAVLVVVDQLRFAVAALIAAAVLAAIGELLRRR